MPFSSDSGKWAIRRIVNQIDPNRVLDVGAGCGTYSKLFRRPRQHWTGLEIWRPYIKKYGLLDLYDEIIEVDARAWQPNGHWDVAFAGDILEHMTADEARTLLDKLRAVADTVIVSIPIGYYPQGIYEGNPYEQHVVDHWTDEAVRSRLGSPVCSIIDNEIGVYIYSTKQVSLMKIAVYSISKNEEKFVERWIKSAEEADYIVLADTGSTDKTVELAKKYEPKVQVYNIYISPWRFDLARNASLALLPADADICICLDVDEVLVPGWRAEIEKLWNIEKTTRLRYGFDWGHGIVFQYEKIHARKGYRWHHPCHEYPVPDGRIKEVYAQTDKVLVKHLADPTKSRSQYMGLLELSVKEDPKCPRNAFYYARELTFNRRWAEARDALIRYLDMPEANWLNERCYAMRLLGQSFDNLGKPAEALKWYRRACAEAPYTREPWVDLATACHHRKLWHECYSAAQNALAITDKAKVYTCDPTAWGSKPYDMAALAAYNLGLYDKALLYGREAVALEPNDKRLQSNVSFYEAMVIKLKGEDYAASIGEVQKEQD